MTDTVADLAPLGEQEASATWVVVGAGIVGLCIALRLRQQGHDVLLIDRQGVAAQASRGNAGACAYSDIQPMASPGIVRQAPRWLLDPLGPLSIPPAYLLRITPWLWHFWRASQPRRVAASTRAQVALMTLAAQAMPRLVQAVGAQDQLHTDGNLHLYESQAEWQASLPGWQLRADHGIAFEHLPDPQAVASWQPGLSPALVVATIVPGWQRIDEPLRLCEQIAAAFVAAGGRLRRASAKALLPSADGVRLALEGGSTCKPRVSSWRQAPGRTNWLARSATAFHWKRSADTTPRCHLALLICAASSPLAAMALSSRPLPVACVWAERWNWAD